MRIFYNQSTAIVDTVSENMCGFLWLWRAIRPMLLVLTVASVHVHIYILYHSSRIFVLHSNRVKWYETKRI